MRVNSGAVQSVGDVHGSRVHGTWMLHVGGMHARHPGGGHIQAPRFIGSDCDGLNLSSEPSHVYDGAMARSCRAGTVVCLLMTPAAGRMWF